MSTKVSDQSDPELDELEPVAKRRNPKMAYGETKEAEPAEAKPVKVTGPINIKGTAYAAGDTVMLTDEELASCKEAGVAFEGDEPKDEEAIQAAHDEGVEAQKARIEADAKAAEEANEKSEAKPKAKKKEEKSY